MAKLFDFNNPVWRFMGTIADLFFLTIIWMICSLPIVTIGASTTALYYVALKLVRNHEQYIIRSFFKAMKESFFSSTVIWIILLALGLIPAAGLYHLNKMGIEMASVLFWMLVVITVIYLIIATVVFPLSARLDAAVGKVFFLTFMVGIKHFAWTLLMVVTTICVIALSIFVFWPLLLVGIGAIAGIHALILEYIIFPKYGWNEK